MASKESPHVKRIKIEPEEPAPKTSGEGTASSPLVIIELEFWKEMQEEAEANVAEMAAMGIDMESIENVGDYLVVLKDTVAKAFKGKVKLPEVKVDELRKENAHLREQLIKFVMSPKKQVTIDDDVKTEGGKEAVRKDEQLTKRRQYDVSPDCSDDMADHENGQSEEESSPNSAPEESQIVETPIKEDKRMSPRKRKKLEHGYQDQVTKRQKNSTAKEEGGKIESDGENAVSDDKLKSNAENKVKHAPKDGSLSKKGKCILTYDSEGKICCSYCDKKFVHSSSFYYHVKTHTGERPYKCTYCAKAFYNSTHMKGHLRIHTGEKPFECVICGKLFTEVSGMKKHISTVHSDNKLHQCHKCDKAYKSARDLRNHLKTHDAPDGKPFVCKNCNKRFVSERYARICERSHVSQMLFICMSCGKDFKSSETLRMHEQIHQDTAKHKCTYCNKTFKQQPSLYTHMKIHTRANMNVCQLCGKEFITKYRLRNHMMRHNGERPRKCKLCNKGFVEAHELARHMRVHNEISPYACKHCDRTFKDNSNLAHHERTHGIKKKNIKSEPSRPTDTEKSIQQNSTTKEESEANSMQSQAHVQGQEGYVEGQLVTTVLQPLTSVEQQLLVTGQPINVQVIPFQSSSSPSGQYQQAINVMPLPSQPEVTDAQVEERNSNNLVIMDSMSEGTSILNMDSGFTSTK